MYLYTARQMLCISLDDKSALYILQYILACSILFFHSAKFTSQYSFDARDIRNSCLPKSVVAANVIFLCISSPGAAGWSKIKGLIAFEVTVTFCLSSSISSGIIAVLLLLLGLG